MVLNSIVEPYRFHTNDVVLPVPPGFRDTSATMLEWGNATGQPIHLFTGRLDKTATDLQAIASRSLHELEVTFHGVERIEPPALSTAFPSGQVAVRFRNDDVLFYQRLVFIGTGSYVLSLSTLGDDAMREAIDALTHEVVRTLLLRAKD